MSEKIDIDDAPKKPIKKTLPKAKSAAKSKSTAQTKVKKKTSNKKTFNDECQTVYSRSDVEKWAEIYIQK